MSDDLAITGGADLDAFLRTLAPNIERNIMRSALAAGARVIRDEARANVPVHLGELKKSVRVTTRSKNGTVSASVKAGSKKAWYWRFVEFGTAAHEIKPSRMRSMFFAGLFSDLIEHPGARARPFMRPALDTQANAALDAVGDQIRKRLTREGINTAAPVEGE